jgi:predicted 3-demethylubiquinone-9 3-methyltransferase (glyoxalase superfamily)
MNDPTLMRKITPCLWFDGNAEEAVNFYVSVFKRSSIGKVTRMSSGAAVTIQFNLDGQDLVALNGGPMYKFSEAISLSVDCADQAEVDELWTKLTEGGSPGRCAWLKDRYGLSWQIVPSALRTLMGDPDPAKAQRVMAAMLKMNKIDIAGLQAAHAGA